MPLLQGKTELTTAMAAEIAAFEGDWEERDESENFAQKHDVELAKRAIRDEVRLEIRDQVDEMLRMNLKKIKMQLTRQAPKAGKKASLRRRDFWINLLRDVAATRSSLPATARDSLPLAGKRKEG